MSRRSPEFDADRLRAEYRRQGLCQRELAERVEEASEDRAPCHPSTISRLLSAGRASPKRRVALEKAIGKPMGWLLPEGERNSSAGGLPPEPPDAAGLPGPGDGEEPGSPEAYERALLARNVLLAGNASKRPMVRGWFGGNKPNYPLLADLVLDVVVAPLPRPLHLDTLNGFYRRRHREVKFCEDDEEMPVGRYENTEAHRGLLREAIVDHWNEMYPGAAVESFWELAGA